MPDFTVLTFITEETPYEEVYYKYLYPSINKFSIPIICEKVPNRNSWLKNVAYKPEVILKYLKEGRDNIVFLDADAEIKEFPELFNNIPKEYDIACHFLKWFTWYGHTPGKKELLSGTLFLRNNEKVIKLVEDWLKYAQRYDRWEQLVLEEVVRLHKDIKIYELPIEYCYISTLPDGHKPRIYIEKPCIIHNQVSRKLKKIIGK